MKTRKEIPDEEVRKMELDIFSHVVTICEKYKLRYIICLLYTSDAADEL